MLLRRLSPWCLCLLLTVSGAAVAGQPPLRPGKVTVYHYHSELDDTDQPFSVWLPEDYTPAKKWPLWVQLHGLGGNHRIRGARKENRDGIVVAPDGRGATDYKLWGEEDVVRVVRECKTLFTVNENRVYLYGFSMGGSGSWQIGVHYPDLFAALGPVCGNADHRVWERLWDWGEKNPTWLSPKKRWVENTESAAFFAANLYNLPSYACHGTKDNVVPVGHARSMTAAIRRHNGVVIYDENPEAGHGIPGPMVAEMLRWMKEQRRNPWPRQVVYKTAWRRYEGAYWVRLHRFQRAFAFARIEAEVAGPNRIEVETENLEEFSLHLVPPLVEAAKPVQVTVDGARQYTGPVPSDGWLRLRERDGTWRPSEEPTGLHKTPRLEGPIYHAFMSSFIIVHGTGGDDRDRRVAQDEAKVLADRWNRWARGRARVKADKDVTDEDIASANLILVGDINNNLLIPRVADRLPIRIDDSGVQFGDQRWEGDDIGLKMVHPNPLNPERYVVLFTGTTWRGVYQVVGRFGNWFDWGILDGWHWQDFAVFDDNTYSPETFLAVGYFDNDWQLDPDWYVTGDQDLRVARPPRKTPALRKPPAEAGQIYLSDLQPAYVRAEKGCVARDRSFNAHPIRLGGQTYEHGLGVHPNCDIGFDLGGQFDTFEAIVGTDLEGEESVSAARDRAESFEFMVIGDGKMLFKTGRMRWDSEPRHIYVPIQGVRRLELKIHRRSGPRWLSGPVDWAIARVGEPIHNRIAIQPRPAEPERLAEEIALDGEWELASFPVGGGLRAQAHQGDPSAWREGIAAQVPASAFAALEDAERDDLLRDATRREWWYARSFQAPEDWAGRSVWVELDGAAYVADAWLNGRWIGRTMGPFERGRFNATKGIRLGDRNRLAVRVVAAPAPLAKGEKDFKPTPQHKLVTSQALAQARRPMLGLWRSARVKAAGPCVLRNLHVDTLSLSEDEATLHVSADVRNVAGKDVPVILTGSIGGAAEPVTFQVEADLKADEGRRLEAEVRVPNPRLWWPRELGEQPLYTLAAGLWTTDGVLCDEASQEFGIRTVDFERSGDGVRLSINGQETLPIRGLVWTPADPLLRPQAKHLETLLARAVDCGANALRVWGGGLAETERFYDQCDRLGLLVIQEFGLASAPQRSAADVFRKNVADTIARLRSRPSLVAWAVGGAARGRGPAEPELARLAAALCSELDPRRTCILESPRDGTARLWATASVQGRTYWRDAAIPYDPGIGSPAAIQANVEYYRLHNLSHVLWQLNGPTSSASAALVDRRGRPRHAYYALRRTSGAVTIQADFGGPAPPTLTVGEPLEAESVVRCDWRTLRGATVAAEILDAEGHRVTAWARTLDVPRGKVERPFACRWVPPASQAGRTVFLRLRVNDRAGRRVASNLYCFGVVAPSEATDAPRLRVAWLTAKPQGPLNQEEFLAAAGVEAVRPQAPEIEPPLDLVQDERYAAAKLDEVTWDEPSVAPIELADIDGVVIDAATVLEQYTEEDLRAVVAAVRRGCGLLIEGFNPALEETPLAPLLPARQASDLPSGMARRPRAVAPDDWLVNGIPWETAPVLPRRPALEVAAEARALVQTDPSHPLLVESARSGSSVLMLTESAELSGWSQRDVLYARMLSQLGRLPAREAEAMAHALARTSEADLDDVGQAALHIQARQEGATVALRLTNVSGRPALMAHAEIVPSGRAQSLADGLSLSDNYVTVFPGETQVIRLDKYRLTAKTVDGRFKVVIRARNCVPVPLPASFELNAQGVSLR
jgi:dienelactone hydrolase